MEKRATLVESLNAYFDVRDTGHYFEVLAYPDILIISLNWRLQQPRPLTEDIETLRNEHEQEYKIDFKMLERTGNLAAFTCNVPFDYKRFISS